MFSIKTSCVPYWVLLHLHSLFGMQKYVHNGRMKNALQFLSLHTQNIVKKLSVGCWTPPSPNGHHIGYIEEGRNESNNGWLQWMNNVRHLWAVMKCDHNFHLICSSSVWLRTTLVCLIMCTVVVSAECMQRNSVKCTYRSMGFETQPCAVFQIAKYILLTKWCFYCFKAWCIVWLFCCVSLIKRFIDLVLEK